MRGWSRQPWWKSGRRIYYDVALPYLQSQQQNSLSFSRFKLDRLEITNDCFFRYICFNLGINRM